MESALTYALGDSGGGQNLTGLANGDWIQFNNVDFGSAADTQFVARVASGAGGVWRGRRREQARRGAAGQPDQRAVVLRASPEKHGRFG